MFISKKNSSTPEEQKKNHMRCIICNAIRNKYSDYCTHCGSKCINRLAGVSIYLILFHMALFLAVYYFGFIHTNLFFILPIILGLSAWFSLKYKKIWARKKLM